jgi:hypothetical protein
MEVIGRSDGVLNVGDPKGDGNCLAGGDPHDIGVGQYPWPVCGGGVPLGVDTSSLDPKAARILSKAVAAIWEVYQLQEILPSASRVPGYSKKPVTQKRSSHACLIIKILASIQNSSLIYMWAIDMWGWWITWCGGTRKRWWRAIHSAPLLQEVIRYTFKQYFYKIGKITYLKIVTCIIKMMYCWLCIRFCIISSWRHNISSFWASWLWRDR